MLCRFAHCQGPHAEYLVDLIVFRVFEFTLHRTCTEVRALTLIDKPDSCGPCFTGAAILIAMTTVGFSGIQLSTTVAHISGFGSCPSICLSVFSLPSDFLRCVHAFFRCPTLPHFSLRIRHFDFSWPCWHDSIDVHGDWLCRAPVHCCTQVLIHVCTQYRPGIWSTWSQMC